MSTESPGKIKISIRTCSFSKCGFARTEIHYENAILYCSWFGFEKTSERD